MENSLGEGLRELPGPLMLTGHTGFKGTWMTLLLEYLEVPVVGYSLLAEKDSLFDRANRSGAIPETFSDIRDYEKLEHFIDYHKPSTIIHMAAQPFVLKSYENPRDTFEVNVMGTANLLDIAFKRDFVKAIIIVTTDKVYRNDNTGRAFIETDPLGGKDPYSASKVGTEAVVTAWQQISKISGGPIVVSVRAGNVIGGGDFGENRIIPDIIRGIYMEIPVHVRQPESTRPWQHVLDPLVGYLMTLKFALTNSNITSLNFGPTLESLKVEHIVKEASENFPTLQTYTTVSHDSVKSLESQSLELNPDKAIKVLSWRPIWSQEEAIKRTFKWWKNLIEGHHNPIDLCIGDVIDYMVKVNE
jgi:CDP-glucose 4,6-dehydratase